jgi:hypothetical protein
MESKLLRAVFGPGVSEDSYGSKRVETLLSRLRSKVHNRDPAVELPIRARHGIGYAFLADLQEKLFFTSYKAVCVVYEVNKRGTTTRAMANKHI